MYFQERVPKIEIAFRKFDLDGDGYLNWEEFSKVLCMGDVPRLTNFPSDWYVPFPGKEDLPFLFKGGVWEDGPGPV